MKVVVTGGGPSGLFAAWKLAQSGYKVTVLEKEKTVGGLAASPEIGGNFYGFGTHHLHNPDPEKIRPFAELMGTSLVELDRQLAIKFMGGFYPYPLKTKDLLSGLPARLIAVSGASLALAMARRRFRKNEPSNAEEAIIDLYGRKLYEIMFKCYTTRFWGVSPAMISKTFVDKRMPGINAVEKIKQLLGKARLISRESIGKNVAIGSGKMYTTSKGTGAVFSAVAEAVEKLGGTVLTSAKVVEVKHSKNQALGVLFEKSGKVRDVPCDLLVSTMPVNHLALSLRPRAPEPVLNAAARLGYRGLLVVCMLVCPRKSLGAMFTYFPDRCFHRLAETKAPPADIKPKGCAILMAEITCDAGDDLWNNPSSIREKVVADLVDEGLIGPDSVLETHFLKAPEAYPKYNIGFEADINLVRKHLETLTNTVSTGRQGGFRFTPMVPSMYGAWSDTRAVLRRLESTPIKKGGLHD